MHDLTARDLESGKGTPEPGLRLAEPSGEASASRECPKCKQRVPTPDQSCRGCGTELIDTTTTITTITSDPAPAAPAGGPLARKLDPEDVDAANEVLEGRLDFADLAQPPGAFDSTMLAPRPTTGTVVGPAPRHPHSPVMPPAPSSITTLPGEPEGGERAITLAQSRVQTLATSQQTPGGTVIAVNPLLLARKSGPLAKPKVTLADAGSIHEEAAVTLVETQADDTSVGPLPHEPQAANEHPRTGDTQVTGVPPATDDAPTLALPAVVSEDARTLAPVAPAPAVRSRSSITPIPAPNLAPREAVPVVAPEPGATATFVGTYLADGSAVQRVHVPEGESLEIGRKPGSPFAADPYLARYHAALVATPEGIVVEDFGTINGLFVRLTAPAPLRHGDQFRIGEELLSYEEIPSTSIDEDGVTPLGCPNPGYWSKVNVLLTPEQAAATYPVDEAEVIFGREEGHIIFPDDQFCSSEHCRLVVDDEGARLEDLGSQNGTFIRVRSGDVLPYGSVVLVGRTLIKLERSA